MRLMFDDAEGVSHCGLWHAPLVAEETETAPPSTEVQIKQVAKMAAVAIPLHYVAGKKHEDGMKYSVITNWWRERRSNGSYGMPNLDFDLYQ